MNQSFTTNECQQVPVDAVEFWTVAQAASILHVTTRTIYNYRDRGWLPVISVNCRKKLIRRSALEAFIRQLEAGTVPLSAPNTSPQLPLL